MAADERRNRRSSRECRIENPQKVCEATDCAGMPSYVSTRQRKYGLAHGRKRKPRAATHRKEITVRFARLSVVFALLSPRRGSRNNHCGSEPADDRVRSP